jgi:hypothetical protein
MGQRNLSAIENALKPIVAPGEVLAMRPRKLLNWKDQSWVKTAVLASCLFLSQGTGQSLAQSKKGIGEHPHVLVELNSHLLPRFTKPMAEGQTKVTIKNPYHFKAYYGLRFGPRGKDFQLEGKESITLALPDGEYILFLRFIKERQVRESISFTIEDGVVDLEDAKKNSQYSTVSIAKEERRRNRR